MQPRKKPSTKIITSGQHADLLSSPSTPSPPSLLCSTEIKKENSNQVHINEQKERRQKLAVSEADKMAEHLTRFDQDYQTLIEYFAIMGTDNGQLRKLINELIEFEQQPNNQLYTFYQMADMTRAELIACLPKRETPCEEQKGDPDDCGSRHQDSLTSDTNVSRAGDYGLYRRLRPSVLERFPVINRQTLSMPEMLKDFFFDMEEYVLTKKDVEKRTNEMERQGKNPDQMIQCEVCTGIDGEYSYITAHMFYEDLSLIQESLPPINIHEELNSKEVDAEVELQIDEHYLQEQENAKNFVYQPTSDDSEELDDIDIQSPNHPVNKRRSNYYLQCRRNRKLPKDTFFVKKGFCLITHKMPASKQLNKFNIFLRKALQTKEGQLFGKFEEYITRLLFTIPMPQRNDCEVQVLLPKIGPDSYPSLDAEIVTFAQPGLYRLPYADHTTIQCLFEKLTVDNVMRVFKRVLLDTSNLFVCKDPVVLFNVCEAFRALIFPFKYDQIYIPHVPQSMLHQAEVPMTFILGIQTQHLKQANQFIRDGTYIIELDEDKTDKIWQQPHTSVILNRQGTTKDISIDDLPELPQKLSKTLKEEVGRIVKKAKGRKLNVEEVETIRELFFNFFCILLKNFYVGQEKSDWKAQKDEKSKKGNTEGQYNMMMSNHETDQYMENPNYLFNTQAFLQHCRTENIDEADFLRVFCINHLFQRLIQREANQEDQNELQIFRDRVKEIRQKGVVSLKDFTKDKLNSYKNRKDKPKPFVSTPFWDIIDSCYKKNGQESVCSLAKLKHFVSKAEEKPQIQVYLRPSLIYKYKITPQIVDQKLIMNLFNTEFQQGYELIRFNQEMKENVVAFSNHAKIMSRRDTLKTKFDLKKQKANIFICWLLIFCGTFKYQEKQEKEFLAFQAIAVVKKMYFRVDEDVVDLIKIMMYAAYTYGSEEIVKYFFELYSEDLKLPQNQTVQNYMLSALGKGKNLATDNQANSYEYMSTSTQFQRLKQNLLRQPEIAEIASYQLQKLIQQGQREQAHQESIEEVQQRIRQDGLNQATGGNRFKSQYRKIKNKETPFYQDRKTYIEANYPKEMSRDHGDEPGFFRKFYNIIKKPFVDNEAQRNVLLPKSQSAIPNHGTKGQSAALEVTTLQRFNSTKKTERVLSPLIADKKISEISNPRGTDKTFSISLKGCVDLSLRKTDSNGFTNTNTNVESQIERESVSSNSHTPTLQPQPSQKESRQSPRHPSRKSSHKEISKNDEAFLDQNSKKYKSMRKYLNVKPRTFLLPEDQTKLESDSCLICLQHTCQKCRKELNHQKILKNTRGVPYYEESTGQKKINWQFFCYNCHTTIYPELVVNLGRDKDIKTEKVLLLHPCLLRNLEEVYLSVDVNYRTVIQRNVDELRLNLKLYWNLIYYFTLFDLPYELIVPYEDSHLFHDLSNEHLKVRTKQTLLELSQKYGPEFVEFRRQKLLLQKIQEQKKVLSASDYSRRPTGQPNKQLDSQLLTNERHQEREKSKEQEFEPQNKGGRDQIKIVQEKYPSSFSQVPPAQPISIGVVASTQEDEVNNLRTELKGSPNVSIVENEEIKTDDSDEIQNESNSPTDRDKAGRVKFTQDIVITGGQKSGHDSNHLNAVKNKTNFSILKKQNTKNGDQEIQQILEQRERMKQLKEEYIARMNLRRKPRRQSI